MATKIKDGPFKGFYFIESAATKSSPGNTYVDMQNALKDAGGGRGLAWYKYSPPPGVSIQGFNSQYLPFIDGYYYVPLDTTINVRRQLYALENKLVPADGNTEVFNLELNKVHVPPEWCPHYIDPCIEPWCKDCYSKPVIIKLPLHVNYILKWIMIISFCFLVGSFFAFFIIYG